MSVHVHVFMYVVHTYQYTLYVEML